MTEDAKPVDKFVRSYMATFNVGGLAVRQPQFEAEAREEFESLCQAPVELDVARHKKYAIIGTKVDDYRDRIIGLSEGRAVLAGIRFVGGDSEKPFLAAWPDYCLDGVEQVRSLATDLDQHFAVFSPKALQVFAPSGSSLERELEQIAPPRRWLYVGAIESILASPELPRPLQGLKIARPIGDGYYDTYLGLYKELHASGDPLDLANEPNDREDLDDAFKAGMLWNIVLGGECVGMLQAEEGSVLGEQSLYISDIIVQRHHRGKSLGPLAQLEFLRQVGEGYRYLYGEILEENTPSISAAKKLGRRPIRSEFLVPLATDLGYLKAAEQSLSQEWESKLDDEAFKDL